VGSVRKTTSDLQSAITIQFHDRKFRKNVSLDTERYKLENALREDWSNITKYLTISKFWDLGNFSDIKDHAIYIALGKLPIRTFGTPDGDVLYSLLRVKC
jgi:hypothetical protein